MTRAASDDLDYLVTRLHARRGRMAEGPRLDAVCGRHTISELGRALTLEPEPGSAEQFQRRLVQDLIQELTGFRKHVDEADRDSSTGCWRGFSWRI